MPTASKAKTDKGYGFITPEDDPDVLSMFPPFRIPD